IIMRKLNEKLIKQVALGDIAVENTGTLADLREVLKAAFPKDNNYEPNGTNKYYQSESAWSAVDKTTLPSVPLTDFFISEPEVSESTELQWGQPVEVRDSEKEKWRSGYVFGCMCPNYESVYPFLVFNEEGGIDSSRFRFCRPIQAIKLTRAEY